VADVPVGILLSGGLDSSLITALAARAVGKVKTFTIGFPGHGKFDETEHARLIARHFGTEHIELSAEPNTADLLRLLARQIDEPMVNSSVFPNFMLSRLVRQHCTVALGGDGGDELFGGYTHYSHLLQMEVRSRCLPLTLRQAIAFSAENLLPVGFRGRKWLQALGRNLERGLFLSAKQFDANIRRRLMAGCGQWGTVAEMVVRQSVPQETDLLQRATRLEFDYSLAEDMLVKVDRTSMLNSLEVRAPLLDYRIIEFAFGRVPSRLKATTKDKKILLKRLAVRLLPPEFDRQRKQGFSIPITQWLKAGPFRDLFWEVLTDPQCLFDRRTINDLMKWQDRGGRNGEQLFALVFFEHWRREYGVVL